jgi:hypothetical protein
MVTDTDLGVGDQSGTGGDSPVKACGACAVRLPACRSDEINLVRGAVGVVEDVDGGNKV